MSDATPLIPHAPLPVGEAIRSGFRADWRAYSLRVALVHLVRRCRIALVRPAFTALAREPAYRLHARPRGALDPLFFLAERHFLIRGLRLRARLAAVQAHYRTEGSAFGPAYTRAVYLGDGLVLWRRSVGGVDHDIRLMRAAEAAHEGGLDLVLHVGGARVCVLSFSWVPAAWADRMGRPSDDRTVAFVVRKQQTQERTFQAGFNRAFDRVSPAHLCLAALSGMAEALGQGCAIGIDPARHPSRPRRGDATFLRSYAGFWDQVGGRPGGPLGVTIDLPLRFTPLGDLDATKRKRAVSRRRHCKEVAESARCVIADLRAPGQPSVPPCEAALSAGARSAVSPGSGASP